MDKFWLLMLLDKPYCVRLLLGHIWFRGISSRDHDNANAAWKLRSRFRIALFIFPPIAWWAAVEWATDARCLVGFARFSRSRIRGSKQGHSKIPGLSLLISAIAVNVLATRSVTLVLAGSVLLILLDLRHSRACACYYFRRVHIC